MQMIDNMLNKGIDKLTFKERQVIVDYFRMLVKKEFEEFKTMLIADLLKYQKDNFINYMYNKDVTDGVFDYYDTIEDEIVKECVNLRKQNETEYKRKIVVPHRYILSLVQIVSLRSLDSVSLSLHSARDDKVS